MSGDEPDPDPEPQPPEAPAPDDCCGSGCVRCVFDLHEEAMDRYRERHAAWQARQAKSQ